MMNKEHRLILKKEHDKLSEMKLDRLEPFLKKYKIFNRYMWMDIKTTEDMLDELPHRGPKAFQNLIEILREAEYVKEANRLESHAQVKKVDPASYYLLPTKPLGYCLIINNENFNISARAAGEDHRRHGSDVDANSLSNVLEKIGFEVDVQTDLKAQVMYDSLVKFSKKNFTNVHSAIIIILSHGGQKNNRDFIFGSDEEYIWKDEILDIFNNKNCVQLQNKPRVFFFVCCRGDEHDYGAQLYLPKENIDSVQTESSETMPTYLDILLVHSTLPNHASVRDVMAGSYFCQEFTKILKNYFLEYDLDDMINRVNQELAKKKSQTYQSYNIVHKDFRGQRKKFMFCQTSS